MNKQEFKSKVLNENRAMLRSGFINLINAKMDTDAEAFLKELIEDELVIEFGHTFIGFGEGVHDLNYPFFLAVEYELPLNELVMNRSSALYYSTDHLGRLFDHDPPQLQFASSRPIDLKRGLEQIFDIEVLPPEQLKGIAKTKIEGVSLRIFSKTRLLFYAFGPEERFYKSICNFIKMDPDYDPESIKQLGSELGQMKEADIILACLNSVAVPLDRTANASRIAVETLFEQPVDNSNKELFPMVRAFYAQLQQGYDLYEVMKVGTSLGKKAEAYKLYHMLQTIRESRDIY